jgi:hypothetical protein
MEVFKRVVAPAI